MTKSDKSSSASLSTFISDFVSTSWEKSACVRKAPEVLARITAADLFALLVRYCDQARDADSMAGVKFYVNGVRLEPFEAHEHLPTAEDKDFSRYHKRVSRGFRDYALVCDKLYSVMSEEDEEKSTRESILRFTDALFRRVGIPNRFAEIGLYLGNYRKTPFGVHVDPCGVLSLPVVGEKKFRIWKSEVVQKHPELKEAYSYDEFKTRSKLLTVKPGEMAYWPSSDWHIAEGRGTFSVTWSIGVWVDLTADKMALTAVQALLESKLTSAMKRGAKKTALKYSNEAPAELERAVEALAGLSKNELRATLTDWWTTHIKANGFK